MTETLSSAEAASQSGIRDAACVVVIDHSKPEPTLLMGRRHADQVFLPDKWVFPGGRVDAADRTLAHTFDGPYLPHDLAPELRPFALAAVRELCEETGMLIGSDATEHHHNERWPAFTAAGYAPAPVHLYPLARAITPPGRVRRYDTWFFTASRSAVANMQSTPDGELLDLNWFTLDDARKLDLPNITRLVLDDVSMRLQSTSQTTDFNGGELPFYYADACGLQRTLISCTMPQRTP
ncbi:NUDIX hydrolase [Hyphomicrobium denitrificans 1NES1]|uniref:NUDIX hydrolase n=1 Tax=Hyphomicrobium denitrificans 1NES1 TaxID=670307 RepID=N0BF13_9HYPH|nr:NUDIX hydrolase [Hyphomicrobium denitrificans]AGK58715.1 NUDIX hydrolase [Hyphomicrobium denitrificans 1NES1]